MYNQRLSKPVSINPVHTSEILREHLADWTIFEIMLPCLVWGKAEVFEIFVSNENRF